MTFQEYQYKRPNLKRMTAQFKKHMEAFEAAQNFEEVETSLKKINRIRRDFNSMSNIGRIRHTLDTKNEEYDVENRFFDENEPVFGSLVHTFYKKLITSPFRKELEQKWGKQFLSIAELSIKTFEPKVLNLIQEENKLGSAYSKLKAEAQIELEGNTYNLSSIIPLETSTDRAIRKKAAEAKWQFFSNNAPEVERIYDESVKIRHKIATELGYKNFVELGYARMLRADYNAAMVANFRKQVKDFIVPISQRLYERQRKRLGLDTFTYYDEDYRFTSGNPKPKGSPEEILRGADKMYAELSKETDIFFRFMRENDLMDLVARDGKETGGYCTFIPKYRAPYIFSNFNGTSGDIDVLTHEAGHAFQVFSSRNMGVEEYYFPTYEACEIHSMSMEFFTWPWMYLFFAEDTDKYHFAHLTAALQFLPYGVSVDEFQHFVYENPTATIEERNQAWREIEKKYLPHRNYEGNTFLENGGFWQKQSHIFKSPFYYIDYTLAQICAFQFWKKSRETPKKAWADYVRLCKAGGSQSFLDLVKLADLRSPFDDGCVESVIDEITAWLDSVDDSKF